MSLLTTAITKLAATPTNPQPQATPPPPPASPPKPAIDHDRIRMQQELEEVRRIAKRERDKAERERKKRAKVEREQQALATNRVQKPAAKQVEPEPEEVPAPIVVDSASGQWHKPENTDSTRRKAPVDTSVDSPVDSEEVSTPVKEPKYRTVEAPDVVQFEGKEYNRDEHPMFFVVVDWLNGNRDRADTGVRKIANETRVSKSYVAVARNWWRKQQV